MIGGVTWSHVIAAALVIPLGLDLYMQQTGGDRSFAAA